ncbi:hypothetical protein [Staphylococcus condimenti]|nr:hypothetical protein [Staphylococcus condimenti]
MLFLYDRSKLKRRRLLIMMVADIIGGIIKVIVSLVDTFKPKN